MRGVRLARVLFAGAALVGLGCLTLSARAQKEKGAAAEPGLAEKARKVLDKHCFECHGKDPKKVRGDVNLLAPAQLVDPKRGYVVQGKPEASKVIEQIENEKMPPGRRERVSPEEREVLRKWIAEGAALPGGAPVAGPPADPSIAARVKELFRERCFECHGGSKLAGDLRVLDHASLVKNDVVVPGEPDRSILFQRVTAKDASIMPKKPERPLDREEIDLVRAWIERGAPAFPEDVKPDTSKATTGLKEEYIYQKILDYVRDVSKTDRNKVGSLRFFSLTHLLTAGATREALQTHRLALFKAVNHLTWKGDPVLPVAIDAPLDTIYAVNIAELGWDETPFTQVEGKKEFPSTLNLFDLILLEYPYAHDGSATVPLLAREFLAHARQVRPIMYVRADWFASVATQSPLYEDLLQLPWTLSDLESRLGVRTENNLKTGLAWRAGMTTSNVSAHNRIVERHPLARGAGAYWKSYDFKSSKGDDNIFRNPLVPRPAGGEMIFNLPNGLQGYFITNGVGVRIDAAPTEIVADIFAGDKTVRNGLSCMRCHDQGMIPVVDEVGPAFKLLPGRLTLDPADVLKLYVPQETVRAAINEDRKRFTIALKKILGETLPLEEPLRAVTTKYLDGPLFLSAAAGELGEPNREELRGKLKTRAFTTLGLAQLAAKDPLPGAVRRDAWEDYYDQAVRAMEMGNPMLPLDGLLRRNFQSNPPLDVELVANRTTFKPSDELVISVKNKSKTDLFVEVVISGNRGRIALASRRGACVAAGARLDTDPIEMEDEVGTFQVTLFTSDKKLPAGVVLRGKDGKAGEGVAGRFVHPFYSIRADNGRVEDVPRVVKKTIDIQTVR